MTIKQRFISFDGVEFKTKEGCLKYEKFRDELAEMGATLKKIKQLCGTQKDCNSCMFYSEDCGQCILRQPYPCNWDLKRIGG